MTLKVAFQMDPMEGLNIAGDSSFALMLSAQARGYTSYHYTADQLNYADGKVWVTARPVTVERVEGAHFSFGAPVKIDLAEDVDVIWMRQDPPFDLGYITATHLLERVRHKTLVVNDPVSVRNAPEKVFVLDFAQFMPPTLVTMKPSGEIADAQAATPAAGTQQLQMIFPDKVIKEGEQ